MQKAVNRIQSEAETRTVIDASRANGFVSVNADLIYGLPLQTVSGFAATLDKVIEASPDRIALYSYAHVPHMSKTQKQIEITSCLRPIPSSQILALAIEKLGAAGYVYIGMDHFAKPGDELAVAQRERKLHRNFQGYSTRPDCDLIAFGISAIGKIGPSYAQNVKTLDEYYARLDTDTLPVLRGVDLNEDDLIRRDTIQKLMCDFELDFAALIAGTWHPLCRHVRARTHRARAACRRWTGRAFPRPAARHAARPPARAHRRNAVRPLPARVIAKGQVLARDLTEARYCMNQPWLTTSDWPVSALEGKAAKNSAVSATS